MHNIRDFFTTKLSGDTRRLSATYLVIIMCLTIIFSSIIYAISSSHLNRPLSSNTLQPQYYLFSDGKRYSMQELLEERAAEARAELIAWLFALNLAVAVGGAFFSYFLARKTLEPIEAAMQAQVQFVSDASHELRTPLTALQLTNEVALRKKKLSVTEAKELIGHNITETTKLRTLSEALLGLAEQDGIRTIREQFDVSAVVASAAESLAPVAADKSISINYDVPGVFVTTNKSALEQVIRILLDNAVKYSPAGTVVTVTAAVEDSHVVIAVRDEGPGIAPRHQTKIFERFYRIDESRSSQHTKGSGLGLAIAKSIAQRHGFGLSVNSKLGKGAEFTIQV